MYTRCSSLVAGEEVGGEQRGRDGGRVGVNGRRERTPDGRRFQTHLEEKEKEADGEMRGRSEVCL